MEISLDDALLVCEKGELKIGVLDKPEIEYRKGNGDLFAKPVYEWENIDVEPAKDYYNKVLEGFVKGEFVAEGKEAINSLYISNAIYLSSWKNRKVLIPKPGSDYELEFEKEFEDALAEKTAMAE